MSVKKISIIGSSKFPENKLSKKIYEKMIIETEIFIQYIIQELKINKENIILCSGGAGWSDHIVIELYSKYGYKNVILNLPCEWDEKKKEFFDNGKSHWMENPGKIANIYHKKFSNVIGKNTLEEIDKSIKLGIKINIFKGFHNRNTEIAKCDYLLAFGWEEKLTKGGTYDTWKKSNCKEKYYCWLKEIL